MTKRSRPGDRRRKDEETAENDPQPPPSAAADAPGPAPQPAADESAADELDRLRDRLLRLQAEFDNYRKRTEREREEQARRSTERLMRSLLPTLDNFEMGLKSAAAEDAAGPVIHGMKLILSELRSALENEGLQPIDAEGRPFDPRLHEAVAVVPSRNHEDGTVVQQIRRGYRLGDYLLRPASVVVAHNDHEPDDDGEIRRPETGEEDDD